MRSLQVINNVVSLLSLLLVCPPGQRLAFNQRNASSRYLNINPVAMKYSELSSSYLVGRETQLDQI